jgi:hypothetical protein
VLIDARAEPPKEARHLQAASAETDANFKLRHYTGHGSGLVRWRVE